MTVHRLIERKQWKARDLGEAAYLAYHREKSYRAKRAQKSGFNVVVPPDEVPEWQSLSSAERSAWAIAAVAVAKLLDFGEEDKDETEINGLEVLASVAGLPSSDTKEGNHGR